MKCFRLYKGGSGKFFPNNIYIYIYISNYHFTQQKDFYHVTNTIKLFFEQTQCLGNVLVQIELFLYR
jgi:hypothetical protein